MIVENDLIRRGDVLKIIEDIKCDSNVPKNYGTLLDIMRMVRNLPKAYDVEDVVEGVTELSQISKFISNGSENYLREQECWGKAISMIREGKR